MDEKDARKVVRVLLSADSGCPCCVETLVTRIIGQFPELAWDKFAQEEEPDWS